MFHRSIFHNRKTYERFTKGLNLSTANIKRGSIRDIKLLLKNNLHLNVCVHIYEARLSPHSGNIQVWKYGKIGVGKNQVNILHTFQFERKAKQHFYFYIKSISSIYQFQQKKYPCLVCFDRFTSKLRLYNHLQKCTIPQPVYPEPNSFIEYDEKCKAKYHSTLSIVGFADFESKLNSIPDDHDHVKCKKCLRKDCSYQSYTKKVESHELVSYSLVFVDAKCIILYEKHFCGRYVEQNFFETLNAIEEPLLRKTSTFKDIKLMKPLTERQKAEYDNTNNCYMCKQKFEPNIRLRIKNRDHSHFNGEYMGPACTWCNLLNRSQRQIPLYFHNFKGYDSKIVMSCIKKSKDLKSKFKILSSNSQNFRSITYRAFRFCDSLEHMPISLDNLIQELNKSYSMSDFKIFQ